MPVPDVAVKSARDPDLALLREARAMQARLQVAPGRRGPATARP